MNTNVEVEKNNQESTANLIRRFTKRVQGSGIIPKVRKNRYFKREKSKNVNRTARLSKIEKSERYQELIKLGKIQDPRNR